MQCISLFYFKSHFKICTIISKSWGAKRTLLNMTILYVLLFLGLLWAEIHVISSFTDTRDGNVPCHPFSWSNISILSLWGCHLLCIVHQELWNEVLNRFWLPNLYMICNSISWSLSIYMVPFSWIIFYSVVTYFSWSDLNLIWSWLWYLTRMFYAQKG